MSTPCEFVRRKLMKFCKILLRVDVWICCADAVQNDHSQMGSLTVFCANAAQRISHRALMR